ncbi:acetyl-CoA acetyltransferase [Aeromicrobium sp. PE09-221]|uniref:thiolase domain-containing protein n=1 Tax=Aeromicrobium sp. PE09-221 TaxID=1898043 RepID=UPI000B3E98DC|nr:thiolase domain-containing protein [Aeromicrobium sp. PE09-221]OUZ11204.1 acetyl-CoA acetyltransferase [Aeromicrobium sp. PE09-221]
MRNRGEFVVSGWGHTRFGKHESTLEELIVEAAADAIASAGLAPGDIDEIVLGHFNAGMQPLAFSSSLVLQTHDALAGVPATRVENACASGAAAFQTGIKAVLSGSARRVLVVGAEKMTGLDPQLVGSALIGADYDHAGTSSSVGFAGLFAEVATAYAGRIGDPGDAMARIAEKNHRHGASNPLAHLRRELTYEECSTVSATNPMVAAPLRRSDCSPVSDGAAAIVLSTAADASSDAHTSGAAVAGWGQANDFLPAARRDPIAFAGSATAWQRAIGAAGVRQRDLSFVELHDCFTIAELVLYDVLGLVPEGMSAIEAARDGWFGREGALPVNVSGGLKSKGHPVGATGVSQIIMAAMQLTGTAGASQLPDPRVAAVHNMGGLAIANYAHVLTTR